MAKLKREDVLKLAQLARIELSAAEVEEFTAEISEILQYVEQLQSVAIEDEPTYQVTGLTNVTRKDVIKGYGYDTKALLRLAPSVQDEQIKVKRMLT